MASASDIAKSLIAAIGENDEASTVSQFLDTGYPELNFALSSRFDGGLPVGRIIEISGPPSSGKTAIATAAMAHAQKAGGIAGFMDHERSFSTVLAPKLGLDTKPGRFIFKKPKTFEESITYCTQAAATVREKKLIPDGAPICWVFDSMASMVPQSVLLDQKTGRLREAAERNMNDNTALARATSAHMPAFAQLVEEFNVCAIFLNQIRMKIGVVYGDPRTTPGGDAPKFYASSRLMLSSKKITKATETIGAEVTGQVIKNKVARPFLAATWRFMFQPDGTGKFDVVRSTLDFLVREKALEGSAGRVKWKGTNDWLDATAARIEAKGEWKELLSFLPSRYEPPVAVVDLADEAA
jgi:recombination protein RecA